MRAISLWEPWASAIALGLKKIETRSWHTPVRGLLAIHAAKTKEHAEYIYDPEVWPHFQAAGLERSTQLPFGCVVATCRLVDCVPTEELLRTGRVVQGSLEYHLGGYEPSRFGWILEDVVRLEKPNPARGSQGFWAWNESGGAQ